MQNRQSPYRLLYVCRHNAVRSQLAEALTRQIGRGRIEVTSAGIEPAAVPLYVAGRVARLLGRPVELQSRRLDDVSDQHFDTIVTLCDKSHATLPEHPEDTDHIRWNFSHPDDEASLRMLEIELSERIRVFLQAKHLL